MSTPKQRHSKSRVTRKRYRYTQKTVQTGVCPNCKEAVLPHRMCKNCGQYKGREVVNTTAKIEKKK